MADAGVAEINKSGEVVRKGGIDSPSSVEQRTFNVDVVIGKSVETVCRDFGLSPKEVYIPGSGTDVLPAMDVLRGSNILYADIDQKSVSIGLQCDSC